MVGFLAPAEPAFEIFADPENRPGVRPLDRGRRNASSRAVTAPLGPPRASGSPLRRRRRDVISITRTATLKVSLGEGYVRIDALQRATRAPRRRLRATRPTRIRRRSTRHTPEPR